ncbi:MAG: hypothetical protein B6U87_00105 [Candidatus Aenigmarchaeota archaeon ex4484_52]|nr:MAG: hypothetical protein B6U87_00105 [Candidatus Aenigmarchaeota archaeon ex4484_52]
MGKLAQSISKYIIKGSFEVQGIVDRPDVIGALFGQTEGLLGQDLDLKELQKAGKIGRIEVNVNSQNGKSIGNIIIPSSLDISETALIAASFETVDRMGPCNVKIAIKEIEDVRDVKRKELLDRAKSLLSQTMSKIPETATLGEELMKSVRIMQIEKYHGLSAGPDVKTSDSIILCEGRADVLNLLRHGIKNAIEVGGTSVSAEIPKICKTKEITVFVDGDKGGDTIIKQLGQIADIDYVTKAPSGKEVEELTKKEIFKALREKIPVNPKTNHEKTNIFKNKEEECKKEKKHIFGFLKKNENKKSETMNRDAKQFIKNQLNEIIGTKAASIFEENNEFVGRIPIKELENTLTQLKCPSMILIDGELDLQLLKKAEEIKSIKHIGCTEKTNLKSKNIAIVYL